MVLAVEHLCWSHDGQEVLRDVSFGVDRGEVACIVGPSGVGKTTLLRVLAGLEVPGSGRVTLAPQDAREASVVLVFQDYLLFPHLSVFENVAFGLRARKLGRVALRDRVQDMLSSFRLVGLAERFPAQLSAGQRQRVALARALVCNPAVLLLDEPFANLDRGLRADMAAFVRETVRRFDVATVSVTHDLEEAFAVADNLGVMLDGRLMQFAPPHEVYLHPVDEATARFMGPVNVVDDALRLALGWAPRGANDSRFIRPGALQVEAEESGPGVVLAARFTGQVTQLHVAVDGHELVAHTLSGMLAPGARVGVRLV